ncbi:GntP family permease [Streptococcus phocae subsp. phocae]|uniref:Cytochrome C biogenesis protein CcmE n=1 Tax=Streptococcus phocae TaxID=119224 RepID=A0A0P6SJT2_9STRE|nr:GntP family permease [Streptococcus phocae]KGR72203.1 cytochrome C biogenesis protein CcmE [Streptococcus phocae subsp. salmonis]KPJ22557.1 cytochrome C biogenesis protein CcmE [Streptococcus phocae]
MEILGSIGVLLAIIAIIYFALKEINILVAAPLATAIVILFNQMDPVTTLLGNGANQYMGALSGYILNYFAVFLLGSILAKLMEASGATTAIANYILNKVGHDSPYKIMVAIFIISSILTYGGISLFVVMFAVLPLARSLFKKIDLSWHLIQSPLWLGIATFTMTILPGTPAIQNVIPIQYLNTSLTAAAIPSLLGSVGCVIFGLLYMKYCLNKSIARGETYATYALDTDNSIEERELPSFLPSIAPLALLIAIALGGSIFGGEFLKKNIIYIALIVAILLAIVLFKNFIPETLKTINLGAVASINPIFATGAAVAFGSVVVTSVGFNVFSKLILNLPGDPLISLTVLTSSITAVTGSSSGSLGIVLPNFAQFYLDKGLDPEMIHRVSAIASNIFTVVPQSGVLLTFLSLTGLTHKTGFKETFISVAGSTSVALFIIILTNMLMS